MKRATLLVFASILLASCVAPVPVAISSPTVAVPATVASTETPIPTPLPTATPVATTCDQISLPAPEAANTDIFLANQRLKRTINLGEALEFPDGGNWRWVDQDEIFYIVMKAGFTAIRVPVNFAAHAASEAPYSIAPRFWESVDSVVNRALKCGLVVIINMHNFGLEGDIPTWETRGFVALWEQITEHYRDYPETSLYFELNNEPGDPYIWNDQLSQGVLVVRKTDPTRPIIIDAGEWGQFSGLSRLKLPDDQNLIASFHYYSPMEFTHQGAGFFPGANEWLGTLWNGTPEEVAVIDQAFDFAANWAKSRRHPIPIFLGEFGSLSLGDYDSRIRWTAAVRQVAEEHDFPWGYWDLCDTGSPTFGIFNCTTYPVAKGKWDERMLEALIPPP